MQLIDNLTREQAIELVRVERSTSDFLRAQLAGMREQIQSRERRILSLEKQLAEANHTIELRGAANMQLCDDYEQLCKENEQLRRELEAIGAGGVEMMGSRR